MPAVRPVLLGLALVLVVATGGCSARTGPEPDPPVVPVTPVPTATVTVTPAPPAEVLLSDQGIGPVTLTPPVPDAYDRLVDLLGPPSAPIEVYCELAPTWWASWGGLAVYFAEDGSLTGWSLGGGPLDDRIRPPFDIYPAEPLERAIEAGGTPELVEEGPGAGDYLTSVGSYGWVTVDDQRFSPIRYVDMNGPSCE